MTPLDGFCYLVTAGVFITLAVEFIGSIVRARRFLRTIDEPFAAARDITGRI
jgi:hypothetical protein